MASSAESLPAVGRYVVLGEIGSGGMGRVYLARLLGPGGFSKSVAIKRMHGYLASDPEFRARFLGEARLAARVQHPNVVSTLDVVAEGDELIIVMEYVRGASLAALLAVCRERGERVGVPVALALASGLLAGLHAAHEAVDDAGRPLGIVHRDVSPQNVMVGADGLARIGDFGIAKATAALAEDAADGHLRGKTRYLAPEQLAPGESVRVERRVDVFAAGVVLWEVLAGRRLFDSEDAAEVVAELLSGTIPPLRRFRTDVSPQLETVVRRALRREPAERWATAREMALELEKSGRVASAHAVAEWVAQLASDELAARERYVVQLEASAPSLPVPLDMTARETLTGAFAHRARTERRRDGLSPSPEDPTGTLPPPPGSSASPATASTDADDDASAASGRAAGRAASSEPDASRASDASSEPTPADAQGGPVADSVPSAVAPARPARGAAVRWAAVGLLVGAVATIGVRLSSAPAPAQPTNGASSASPPAPTPTPSAAPVATAETTQAEASAVAPKAAPQPTASPRAAPSAPHEPRRPPPQSATGSTPGPGKAYVPDRP